MKQVVAATEPVIVVEPALRIVTAPVEALTVATEVLLLENEGVASELVVKALLTEPPQVVALELLAKLAVAAVGVQPEEQVVM